MDNKGHTMKKQNKSSLIINLTPKDYQIFDLRIKKPLTFEVFGKIDEGGSMVLQETDEVLILNKKLEYFTPNSVAILLSISSKALKYSKDLFDKYLNPNNTNIELSKAENKIEFIKFKSTEVCDYIEQIQTSIVFAYTALEAFANLSIPENYFYYQKVKNKGIDERYDKIAIEKWINLTIKLQTILPQIYKTKAIEKIKEWSYFLKLEKYRHEIVHQKSIEHTDFYKVYFQKDIFSICSSAEAIIKFFYDNYSLEKSNPLWPWIVGKEKEFPIFKGDPDNFEVIGNIYEGRKKK